MKFTVIIPARYGSSRLPGKPLEDIGGKPMVQHVYERACKSQASRVVVATDDQRIADAVVSFGGEVFMTAASHESGTDRLQEVAHRLGLQNEDIVVNVQGDEPQIPASVIDQVAGNLASAQEASVATLSEPLASIEQCFDPNVVKVVVDQQSLALYFSRAPIPWDRDSYGKLPSPNATLPPLAQRHIGIYAYRVRLLHQFVTWPVAELEAIERLEQLRVLTNGHRIHVAKACVAVPGGVDTAEDLARLRDQWVRH